MSHLSLVLQRHGDEHNTHLNLAVLSSNVMATSIVLTLVPLPALLIEIINDGIALPLWYLQRARGGQSEHCLISYVKSEPKKALTLFTCHMRQNLLIGMNDSAEIHENIYMTP